MSTSSQNSTCVNSPNYGEVPRLSNRASTPVLNLCLVSMSKKTSATPSFTTSIQANMKLSAMDRTQASPDGR
ncbi:hypothetical protein BDV40DRAFT_13009 [Aspergillus tamarii]|uniref:Uncharacterized protein n=1 Tax=Aspergillus tamarii TaxID=41984 RepID=A0A5N6UJ35_ASPTM|nr:hypothetical protein BDV40DRAFT_13009 [Aspergillus tamarii]